MRNRIIPSVLTITSVSRSSFAEGPAKVLVPDGVPLKPADHAVPKKEPPSALSFQEKNELCDCETVIESGWLIFVEFGNALARIRDKRLYREDYETFESYCHKRWPYGQAYAYGLIAAAEFKSNGGEKKAGTTAQFNRARSQDVIAKLKMALELLKEVEDGVRSGQDRQAILRLLARVKKSFQDIVPG